MLLKTAVLVKVTIYNDLLMKTVLKLCANHYVQKSSAAADEELFMLDLTKLIENQKLVVANLIIIL